jgi:CRISPR system Cascade subunit CasC
MRLELHFLQNFPPANLNRDDTGTPKDCQFGGERRARISSQCIKRSIRTSPVFEQTLGEQIGQRTKRFVEPLAKRLEKEHGHSEEEAQGLAADALDELIGLADSNGEVQKTEVLHYAAQEEIEDLAERVHSATEGDKTISDAIGDFKEKNQGYARAVDIGLFGRFLADTPELTLEAASQVAHAISTNRVSMEFDYYTAVDDLNPDEETGAGMIGTTGYNSSCFYRYMLLDVEHLARNLSPDEDPTASSFERAIVGTEAFTRAAVAAIPTGMQTSFAAQARPQLVLAVVRPGKSTPMSLVNAFEDPARPQNGTSLVQDSVSKLDRHWGEMTSMYGSKESDAFLAMLDSAGSVDNLEPARIETENGQGEIEALVHQVIGALEDAANDQTEDGEVVA